MKMNFNIAMIMALSLVLFFTVVVGAQPLGIGGAQPMKESHYEILCSANGRFAFGQISDSSKDRFMLDTLTGRLWQIAETGDIGLYLRAVPYRNAEGECTNLPNDSSPQAGKKPKNRGSP